MGKGVILAGLPQITKGPDANLLPSVPTVSLRILPLLMSNGNFRLVALHSFLQATRSVLDLMYYIHSFLRATSGFGPVIDCLTLSSVADLPVGFHWAGCGMHKELNSVKGSAA